MHVIKSKREQITLYFGSQKLNGENYYHTGIDIVKEKNSLDTIIAAQKGKVIKIVDNIKTRDVTKGYGNYVEIEHGGNIVTKYCHLKYGSIKIKLGQTVQKYEDIGYMGATGYTFGAHLHFQVIENGKNVDPLPYLQDKKEIEPYKENNLNYTTGNYLVKADVLTVRKGPGTSYDFIRYSDLTQNAKEQMEKLVNYPANGYVKGMVFTAIEIENKEKESWAKTPSGWVCLYKGNEIYCEKI